MATRGSAASLGAALLAVLLAGAHAAGEAHAGEAANKNPPWQEIDAEMARLSGLRQVPAEVVKAIAFRESGVQQWRADGSLVENAKDGGCGMMQLTGATAQQYDVARLKTDWRYNLASGVDVLCNKWERAQRLHALPGHERDRRVIENWFYAIAYYYGAKNEEYVGKIYRHMAERPGVLAQMMREPVTPTLPSAAIPGFAFGDAFLACQGDLFLDKEGKRHDAPTHLGTVGDPELSARLDALLELATAALEGGKRGRAIDALREVAGVEEDLPQRRLARESLAALEAEGRGALEEALSLARGGEGDAALRRLRALAKDYDGLEVAAAARAAADAERERQGATREREHAETLLARLRAFDAEGDGEKAQAAFRQLLRRYPESAAAAAARAEFAARYGAEEAPAKPGIAEAETLLRRARAYMANERYDLAIPLLEEFLAEYAGHPRQREAEALLDEARRKEY